MPRVSVLMSSYNHEAFVAEAILSVLGQRYEDWELIVRDDGSTDGTIEVTSGFKDPRIRHLGGGPRVGGAASLNRCLLHATGELVAVMNSDDVMLPHRLSTQVAILNRQQETAAVFSHAEIVNERGDPYHGEEFGRGALFIQPNRTRHEWLRYFFQKGNGLCHPSALIRRGVFDEIGRYDPLMQRLPDFDLWVRLCAKHEIHVHQEALLKFRLMDDESNASADSPRKRELRTYEHTKVLARFAAEPIFNQLAKILPEWIPPGGTEEERLPNLAKAALAIPSAPHHFFALDCLRDHAQRSKDLKIQHPGGEEMLLGLVLEAHPFSLLAETSTRWSIVCRRAAEADFSNKHGVIVRLLASGTVCTETVELLSGTAQIRLEFDGAYRVLEIESLVLLSSGGQEIWNMANPKGEALQVSGAQLLESSTAGMKLARTEGHTRLLLPEFAPQDGLRLRCSMRIRHDLRNLIRECEELSKKLKAAERRQVQLQKSLTSAVEWQKQSWIKRAFTRWSPPGD